MKKKQIHISISVILAIVMFAAACPVWARNDKSPSVYSDVLWQNKIDPVLYETADQKEGKYLVCIQNQPVSTDILNAKIEDETRFSVSLYETEKFNSCVVPILERKILEAQLINKMQSPLTELVLGKSVSNTIEQAIQKEMDDYIKAKRDVIKALNKEKNDLFVEKYIGFSSEIAFQSRYASMIIAYLSQEDIEKCARSNETIRIIACPKTIPVVEGDNFVDQFDFQDSDISTDSLYDQINAVDTYMGDGIKIGVLELGEYDGTHPQLEEINEKTLFYVGSGGNYTTESAYDVDDHATQVVSLIVGQPIEVDGKTYSGVVPNATVFQTSVGNNYYDLIDSIELLLDYNVSVINCSMGFPTADPVAQLSYTYCDILLDYILGLKDVTFVSGAGNRTLVDQAYVLSPAKAYNAITVGNAKTNGDSGHVLSAPYSIVNSSCYLVDTVLPNKPDISAPGYRIAYPYIDDSTDEIVIGNITGTSFSTPLVTGVVAQMHQANPVLKKNPTATKAALLAGADFDAISGDRGNDLREYCSAARVKSGVGLLNAERAVNIAEAGDYQYSVLFMNATSRYVGYSTPCAIMDIPANSRIRIVMTFNKPAEIEDDVEFSLENDQNLWLMCQGNLVDSSCTRYNNVEVIECVIGTAGRYSIEVYVDEMTQTSTRVLMDRSVAWYIEPAS